MARKRYIPSISVKDTPVEGDAYRLIKFAERTLRSADKLNDAEELVSDVAAHTETTGAELTYEQALRMVKRFVLVDQSQKVKKQRVVG